VNTSIFIKNIPKKITTGLRLCSVLLQKKITKGGNKQYDKQKPELYAQRYKRSF
jgi:hypothetical protein